MTISHCNNYIASRFVLHPRRRRTCDYSVMGQGKFPSDMKDVSSYRFCAGKTKMNRSSITTNLIMMTWGTERSATKSLRICTALRSFGPARLVSSPSVSIDEPVAADRRKARYHSGVANLGLEQAVICAAQQHPFTRPCFLQ